jgi:hypothetical protein
VLAAAAATGCRLRLLLLPALSARRRSRQPPVRPVVAPVRVRLEYGRVRHMRELVHDWRVPTAVHVRPYRTTVEAPRRKEGRAHGLSAQRRLRGCAAAAAAACCCCLLLASARPRGSSSLRSSPAGGPAQQQQATRQCEDAAAAVSATPQQQQAPAWGRRQQVLHAWLRRVAG